MAKPMTIELADGDVRIPIVYEDRSILAIDKPAGWMLAPDSWDHTGRNLQLALQSSLNAGDYWAHSRNLKFLRFIHRLDAETTGLTLFAKSPGVLRTYSEMFEERRIEKHYLAVVHGVPREKTWTCSLPLVADPATKGKMKALTGTVANVASPGSSHHERGSRDNSPKDAETHFAVLESAKDKALIEARPTTGRTHQIRVHLAASGHPVWGDPIYGNDFAALSKGRQRLGLRAVKLAFRDPFQKRLIRIVAPTQDFLREYGFAVSAPVEKAS